MLNTSLNLNKGEAAELTFLRQAKSGILQTVFSVKPCTTQILHILTEK